MGSSKSKPAPEPATVSATNIPPSYYVTFKKARTKIIVLLAPSYDSPPIFAADLPWGWYGDLILHAGPTINAPGLATAAWGKGMHRVIPIHLGEGDEQAIRYGGRDGRFWFALEIPGSAGNRVEKFEWRRSRGVDVKSLGESSNGWKLVRVADYVVSAEDDHLTADVDKDGVTEDDTTATDGLTSDGREIVGVWAPASMRKMNMRNVGRFEFRGSGASGVLGTRWALMAVMSQLAVWRCEMQAASTATAAAA